MDALTVSKEIKLRKIKAVPILLASCAIALAQDLSDSTSRSKPARPQMIRVSAGVLHGLVEHARITKYPEEGLKSQIQGGLIVKVRVDESGRVILITPVEGDPLLIAQMSMLFGNFVFDASMNKEVELSNMTPSIQQTCLLHSESVVKWLKGNLLRVHGNIAVRQK